jgi:hypothetical protein
MALAISAESEAVTSEGPYRGCKPQDELPSILRCQVEGQSNTSMDLDYIRLRGSGIVRPGGRMEPRRVAPFERTRRLLCRGDGADHARGHRRVVGGVDQPYSLNPPGICLADAAETRNPPRSPARFQQLDVETALGPRHNPITDFDHTRQYTAIPAAGNRIDALRMQDFVPDPPAVGVSARREALETLNQRLTGPAQATQNGPPSPLSCIVRGHHCPGKPRSWPG